MNAHEVNKVGVVGLGTMGAGIAQLCIQAGLPTVVVETSAELAEKGQGRIASALSRLEQKGTISETQREATLPLLQPATDISALDGCDLVIEAVFESIEVKLDLFARLEDAVGPETVLATNTSALSVSEIAAPLAHPERVVGMHFFNPAPVLPLVEIVRAEGTSEAAFATAYAFAQRLGKDPIACVDTPGFVVNRILNSGASELWRLQEESGIDVKELDRVVAESKAAPVGPFFLADLIGLDTVLHVAEHLHGAYGDAFYVHAGMRALVAEGKLGAKTGEGFYDHGS